MEIYNILPLVPQVDYKISCCALHGPADGIVYYVLQLLEILLVSARILIVGTSDGYLNTYTITSKQRHGDFPSYACKIERRKTVGRGKKPITNIVVYHEVGLCFTICGM